MWRALRFHPSVGWTSFAARLTQARFRHKTADILGRRAVTAITLTVAAGLGLYFHLYEGGLANQLFVWSATLLIAAWIVFAARRVLIATVLIVALIVILDRAGTAKLKAMSMAVHAYDMVFYLTSWSTLSFLWVEFPSLLAALAVAISGAGIAAALAYHVDSTRVPRAWSLAAVIGFTTATALTASNAVQPRIQLRGQDFIVSQFYASWADLMEVLWHGQLIEAASATTGASLRAQTSCETATKPPHIILIHQESVVPPEYFPGLSYDKSVDRLFRSSDGKLHKLRVETYGGASWLTEFSVLAGVSTYSFGSMRPFVQSLMAKKVRDTLPENLSLCGYRNVVFYPLNKDFVSNGRFYAAIGMPEIYDMRAQKAGPKERDRFYYANAMALMEEHFRTSDRPLFTFIFTIVAHQPYLRPFMREIDVPGGGPGTDPQMHEYLRRLSMARIDYDAFKAELARRFPNERFLILQYGDHQPVATRTYLGIDTSTPLPAKAFITYYAIEGINYDPPPLPDVDTLDVPYLGGVLLEAARLPLSDAYRERRRLMRVCEGRYYGCTKRGEILTFHRRLIESGMMDPL